MANEVPLQVRDALAAMNFIHEQNPEDRIWVGQDVYAREVGQITPHSLHATVRLQQADLGLDESTPAQMVCGVAKQSEFAVRSRLAQAGLDIMPFGFTVDETGDVSASVLISSLTGKPIVNVPESFSLGRFFRQRQRLSGDELEIAAKTIAPEPQFVRLVGGKPIVPYDQEYPSNVMPENEAGKSVAIILPIERYYTIEAEAIDLGALLTLPSYQTRDRIDELLHIHQVDRGRIVGAPFYLAETGPVSVPHNLFLLLNCGAYDFQGQHSPSAVIDPGFEGPVRLELHSQPGQSFTAIDAFAFKC